MKLQNFTDGLYRVRKLRPETALAISWAVIRRNQDCLTIKKIESYGVQIDIHDPWADADEARQECGFDLVADPEKGACDRVIIAVALGQFRALGAKGIRGFGKNDSVLYDIKYVLKLNEVDDRL